jgi:hypothetical protein
MDRREIVVILSSVLDAALHATSLHEMGWATLLQLLALGFQTAFS